MTKDSSLNDTYQFKLPDLGEGIHEAEIVNWLVNVGDTIGVNQPLLEVQTDKALVEIPAPVAGTIKDIRIKSGSMAHLGDTLVSIQPQNDTARHQPTHPSTPPISATVTAGLPGPGQRVLAAPAVRKLALKLGVDLHQVPGTGPSGRVLPSDVRTFAEHRDAQPSPQKRVEQVAALPDKSVPPSKIITDKPPEPVEQVTALSHAKRIGGLSYEKDSQTSLTTEPLTGLRRRIAERMDEAWRIPHVTSFAEVEVSRLVKLRDQLNDIATMEQGLSVTYLPFIIKATIQALKTYPDFNARLDLEQQQITRYRHYHIGVATAIPEGLVVPVIRHADRLSLRQLATELTRLADLARSRKLGLEELSGSTFSITNFGSAGGEQGTPIINPPEVAILGCGRIELKPVVVKGQVKARPVLPLSLSFDHRLIDGIAAAQFLKHLKQRLHHPKLLLLDL